MTKLIKTEVLKLIYLKSTWLLFLVAALFGALNTVATGFAIDNNEVSFGFPNSETTIGVDSIYANAAGSYVFALIIGILMITSEFKHGTAIATFLISPKRFDVIRAKLIVGTVAGLAIQLFAFFAASGAAFVYLATRENAADPTMSKIWSTFLAALLSGAVLAIVGIGIGSLILSQALAITASLIWLFLIEPILILFASGIGKYLVSGAVTGMLSLEFNSTAFSFDPSELLSPTQSALVLLGYAILFIFLATRTTLKRDIE